MFINFIALAYAEQNNEDPNELPMRINQDHITMMEYIKTVEDSDMQGETPLISKKNFDNISNGHPVIFCRIYMGAESLRGFVSRHEYMRV